MTQPALDRFDKRALLVKAETVEGEDAVPVGTTDGFRFLNGTSSTDFEKNERDIDQPFFGGKAFTVGAKSAKIEGDIELYPPATPGAATTSDADCGRILLPAGMAVVKDATGKTTTYNPISSAIPSVTAYWYHVRRLIKVLGGRADLSGLTMQIGKGFMGKASLTGNYVNWATAAIPSVTLPTTVPVVARHSNTTMQLSTEAKGATASSVDTPLADLATWAKSLSVDFGSALSHREYTGKAVNGITGRDPKFTLQIASTDITNDFDPLFVRDSGIILSGLFTLYDDDTKDGLYSALGFRGQIEQVSEQSIDGDDGWQITGTCIPSSAGGDEFKIVFGDASV